MTPTDEKALAEKAAKWLGLEINSKYVWYPEIVQNGFCSDDNMGNCLPVKYSPLMFFGEGIGRDEWEADIVRLMLPPILSHLAKREMEKRGFECKYYWDGMNHEYLFMKPKTNQIDEWDFSNKIYEGYHPEDYKALWLAIEQTGVMDD